MNRRISILSLLTWSLFMAASLDGVASTIELGPLSYDVNDKGTATVLGLVKSSDENQGKLVIDIPETVEYEGVTYTVNALGHACFRENHNIVKVSLPETITSLGEESFMLCSSLMEINLPEHLETIDAYSLSGTAISEITLPKSVYAVGQGAFYFCDKLQDVDLSNVRYIGSVAFYDCKNLKTITIPETVELIGASAFRDTGVRYLALNTSKFIPFSDFNEVFADSPVEYISAPSVVSTIPDTRPNLFLGCPSLFYGRAVIDIASECPLQLTIPGMEDTPIELHDNMSLIVKCEPMEENDTEPTGVFVKPVYLSLLLPEGAEQISVIYQGEDVKVDSTDNSIALFQGEEVENGLKFPDRLPLNKLQVTAKTGIPSASLDSANESTLLYDINGRYLGTCEDSDNTLELPKGIYLLKSGKSARKIIVK